MCSLHVYAYSEEFFLILYKFQIRFYFYINSILIAYDFFKWNEPQRITNWKCRKLLKSLIDFIDSSWNAVKNWNITYPAFPRIAKLIKLDGKLWLHVLEIESFQRGSQVNAPQQTFSLLCSWIMTTLTGALLWYPFGL